MYRDDRTGVCIKAKQINTPPTSKCCYLRIAVVYPCVYIRVDEWQLFVADMINAFL